MWNFIPIQLNGLGSGSNQLFNTKMRIFAKFAVPAQAGITSGATDIVITEIDNKGLTPLTTLLTLTNIVTPYSEIPKKLGIGATGTTDTVLGYQGIGSLNIAITGGVANASVGVWVLLDDD
jgi:hypothetical protein